MTIRAEPSEATHEGGPAPDETPGTTASDGRTTRYRYLIAVVSELETTVTIDQLADVMVRWEDTRRGRTEKSWHDVHEELYHVDLPTLDRAGLLRFDRDDGTVARPGDEQAGDDPSKATHEAN